MFAGQGCQYYQMGRGLYDHLPGFRGQLREMDLMVERLVGRSVIDALYDGRRLPSEPFDEIVLTHAAIFMIEYALARSLIDHGVLPDYTLGVSLGTFAAAAVAGCIDPETALIATVKQAEIVRSRCPPGGMIAVMSGMRSSDDIDDAVVAGVSSSSHFVLAAREDRLSAVEQQLSAAGAVFQRLPVRFAFHSPWIDEAGEEYQAFLRAVFVQTGGDTVDLLRALRAIDGDWRALLLGSGARTHRVRSHDRHARRIW
jgi:acyl transferase domain-containing protein